MSDIQARGLAISALNQLGGKTREYVFNVDKGLRNWNAAKAKATVGVIPLVFIGDSITASAGATVRDSGLVGLYRNAIQFATGLAGHGYLADGVFNPDGTWSTLNSGTNLTTYKGTPTSNPFSFKAHIKVLDVVYATRSDGGTFTVKVDGATVGTINCNGATSSHNVASFTISNVQVHTVQIVPATTGNTYIEGIIAKSGLNGMLVHQVGHPGIKAADYTNQSDIIASTSAFNPLLTVIMLGTNDSGGQVPLATYQNRLEAIAQQALTTGDVLIVAMGDRGDSGSLAIPYSAYVETAKQVALKNNCAFLSIYHRWQKSYAWANSQGFMFDSVHPTQAGHADIAEAIREVLGGSAVAGVFQINYDAQYTYGDVRMNNVPGAFRVPIQAIGLGGSGRNVAVTQGVTSMTIPLGMLDGNYTAIVMPNWNTSVWVTGKSFSGFTVNFGTAAPASATLDWAVSR